METNKTMTVDEFEQLLKEFEFDYQITRLSETKIQIVAKNQEHNITIRGLVDSAEDCVTLDMQYSNPKEANADQIDWSVKLKASE